MPPAAVTSVRASEVFDTRAVISWTVRLLTYTPESYSVRYGTSDTNLDESSGAVGSGGDIEATDLMLSATLVDLAPVTRYFFLVAAENSVGEARTSVFNFTTLGGE